MESTPNTQQQDTSQLAPAPEMEKKASAWVPQWAREGWNSAAQQGAQVRRAAIVAVPEFVVNNSSNIGGAAHVATEMLMLKSGMKGAKLIDNPENPVNWVWQPVKKICKDVWSGSKAVGDYKGVWKGNPVTNFISFTTDTKRATLLEAERQLAHGPKVSLGNPWQTRTTLCGLVAWTLAAIIPEKKESDAEIKRMAVMRTLHPAQYVMTRLGEGLWAPGWLSHKREMIGTGYLGVGICSMIGSWRNRRELLPTLAEDAELLAKGLKHRYTFNGNYFLTALVSLGGAMPLLFALDERRAYSLYGLGAFPRMALVPPSLIKKCNNNEPGWQYYATGKISFIGVDLIQALIGGAEKHTDANGNMVIIDHTKIEKDAIARAREIKHGNKLSNNKEQEDDKASASPSTNIALPSQAERAMPERRAEQLAASPAV